MSKWTPGPWKWSREWKADGAYSGSMGELMPEVLWYGMDGEEGIYCPNEANARLIAAAPEMLEALETAYAELEQCEPPDEYPEVQVSFAMIMRQLERVIAKARGEEHDPSAYDEARGTLEEHATANDGEGQ